MYLYRVCAHRPDSNLSLPSAGRVDIVLEVLTVVVASVDVDDDEAVLINCASVLTCGDLVVINGDSVLNRLVVVSTAISVLDASVLVDADADGQPLS